MRLEFDAAQAPGLEGVPQHEIFGLAVDSGALRAGDKPGVADLRLEIGGIDIEETRGADDAARRRVEGDERQRPVRRPFRQRFLHPGADCVRPVHQRDMPAENRRIGGRFRERLQPGRGQRHKPGARSRQGDVRDAEMLTCDRHDAEEPCCEHDGCKYAFSAMGSIPSAAVPREGLRAAHWGIAPRSLPGTAPIVAT
jgi:hypothetical protein